MISVQRSGQAYALRDDRVELAFHYINDRWRHVVSVLGHGGWRVLISSDEAPEPGGRLSSPALQDLRLEELGSGVCEFQLLGQGAGGIYSAAVRFDAPSRQIDYDFCALAAKTGASLCTVSRYHTGDEIRLHLEQRGPAEVALIPEDAPALKLMAVAGEHDLRTECRIMNDGPAMALAAGCFEPAGAGARNANVRWHYRLSWNGDA